MHRSPRILIVDDDAPIREALAGLLPLYGYEVSTAGHGLEALRVLEEVVPDAVLLDLSMPVMDGVTLLRRLRADRRFARLPVLVWSADPAGRFRDLPADACLLKPVPPDRLIAALARLLQPQERRLAV